ncbi:polyadenylated RNA-binding protein NAB2 [Ceratobasidium sp. AG-Ba]|nr:polyadenylated RNA-binding protein NAB2 [Ceratobasidium sp. AG-Ba]QRW12735.1 polyadenylated RNA-binding protein NAB2 [Ceratobasidium sp. AG-Ba]
MPEDVSSPSDSVLGTDAMAILLSKFEEQKLMIQQLSDRVVLLEGRISGASSIASPVPIPPHSGILPALSKAHAESLSSQSHPSSPSPSVSVSREALTFSPPPFGYSYGPYPGYYYPMHPHYPPPNWGPPPNQPSVAGHSTSTPAASVVDAQATTVEQNSEATSGWGQSAEDAAPTSLAGSTAKKNKSKAKPCKFGDQCNRPTCWFDHSGPAKPDLARNDTPNSTHSPNQPSDNTASNRGDYSKPPDESTKPKQECRYGENCTRKKCWFTHPPGWTPPTHAPESTTDQHTPAPADDSATDQGWGVQNSDDNWHTEQEATTTESDNKWESWEVKPSNDWGVSSNNDWGAPSTNDWGAPASSDWGNPSGSSSTARPSSVNKSKKAPAGTKPNVDKGKKGQKERVASSPQPASNQSTVLCQPEPTEVAHAPASEPLADAATPNADQPSVVDAIVDSLPTPALEPEDASNSLSSLSESENPATPFAWGDEPLAKANSDEQTPGEPPALDTIAPSSMYGSWGPVETSGWGAEELPTHSTSPWESIAQTSQKNQNAKGKGKQKEPVQQKEPDQHQAVGDLDEWAENHAKTDSSWATESIVESSQPSELEPAPTPQGVPEDEIPDWMLPEDDPYAVLGLSRPTTPKPAAPTSRPQSTSNRPRISEMNGANFPPPTPDSNRQAPKTSVASGPTIRPRRTAWTIRSSGESSTTQATPEESSKGSGKQSKKYYGPNKKPNAKASK